MYAQLYSYTTVAFGLGPLITAIVFQVTNDSERIQYQPTLTACLQGLQMQGL